VQSRPRRSLQLLVPAVWIVALACGHGGGPAPTLETGAATDVTPDGLHRIRNSGFANAWMRPDAAFSKYDSVVLAPLLVAYKRSPRPRGTAEFSNVANHPLNEDQLATVKRYFGEAFEKEFTRSGSFAYVMAPGERSLIIVPAILDLVVEAPTDPTRIYESFTSSTAMMTILLDLRDAQTGEVVARFAERRAAKTPGAEGTNSVYSGNTVNSASALRTTFRHWARTLRDRLDRIRERGSLEPEV
jgi:hypothetical protein